MKSALRTIIFALISISFSQRIFTSLFFNGSGDQNFVLLVLGLSAVYFFSRPLLKLLSLPSAGIGFLFMTFVMTLILLYAFMLFVPLLEILPTNTSSLIIFGFMLPSKHLTAFWSGVVTSMTISLVYTFLDWLCSKKD